MSKLSHAVVVARSLIPVHLQSGGGQWRERMNDSPVGVYATARAVIAWDFTNIPSLGVRYVCF